MNTNGTQRKTALEVVENCTHPLLGKPPSLREEVIEGSLLLRADGLLRSSFSFSVGDYPIGIYGARSIEPGSLMLIRRWDQTKETFDPISGLMFVNQGRQFNRLHAGEALFLVEYTSDFLAVTSRVAFSSSKIHLVNAMLPGAPPAMRFEAVELRELSFLG